MGPRQNHQKPVVPIHSPNLKAPFTAAHRSQESRFTPASAETVARFLEKKKELGKLSIPHLHTILPRKNDLAGLGIIQIFQNF